MGPGRGYNPSHWLSLLSHLVRVSHQPKQGCGWFCKPIPVNGNKIQRLISSHPWVTSVTASYKGPCCLKTSPPVLPGVCCPREQQRAVLTEASWPVPYSPLPTRSGPDLSLVLSPTPPWASVSSAVRGDRPGPFLQMSLHSKYQRRQLSRHKRQ